MIEARFVRTRIQVGSFRRSSAGGRDRTFARLAPGLRLAAGFLRAPFHAGFECTRVETSAHSVRVFDRAGDDGPSVASIADWLNGDAVGVDPTFEVGIW